jgi:predicted nucleotidyltransferase
MNLNWLVPNTIYITLHGSQAYGLNNELSDVDVKGIVIPPKEIENNLFHRFEQAENDKSIESFLEHLKNPKNPKFESTLYSLKKFMILAANVNPNIIELLWTDPSNHFVFKSPMDELMESRDLFLSSKAKFTFSGYAYSQLAKIERHRKWIVRGELTEPKRKDFGLPEERPRQMSEIFGLIKSEVERWNLSQFPLSEMERDELKSTIWELILNVSEVDVNEGNWPQMYEAGVIERLSKEYNLKEEVIDILQRERLYKKEIEAYNSWLNWRKNRNPARHELEVKSGYDTKHASHLVRLMRMGLEILNDRKVIVKRPDREEILAIKNGSWSYEQVIEFANSMQVKLDEAYKTTTLPKTVNYEKINELYHKLYEGYHNKNSNVIFVQPSCNPEPIGVGRISDGQPLENKFYM